ncbi:MAG: aminodeoxychorismate synthase component I [Prolixibacteraceae bacterium]|nr:aminodeoxychorismate synthase component I [Prolixibacteraceae bacterium]MBN2773767.1 aminodeoxychorismate synthase component I [Prolixibacteraceae bacterium]
MNKKNRDIIAQMNLLGKQKQPFVFLIDFEQKSPLIFYPDDTDKLLWQTPFSGNFAKKKKLPVGKWEIEPASFKEYKKGFDLIQEHIHFGDSFLLNYTKPTLVNTELSLEEIFYSGKALYKIFLKDQFVCFSPEIFIRIKKGRISSYPMKGTIDAEIPNARVVLKNDKKELAEHNTIVDLIRNDLSMVADDVRVDKFRYIDEIKTNRGRLLQMSSQITGKLPADYLENIGDIIFCLLPAGSISGAPKPKTVEIIQKAEGYKRGFYTGIFGYFDGQNLDSCVLIRYIEKQNNQLVYKSGGGITYLSNCKTEYEEMINKVYVPFA